MKKRTAWSQHINTDSWPLYHQAVRSIVLMRLSCHVCLSLTVMATCASLLFDVVATGILMSQKLGRCYGKTVGVVNDRICFTAACKRTVHGQFVNDNHSGQPVLAWANHPEDHIRVLLQSTGTSHHETFMRKWNRSLWYTFVGPAFEGRK